jgi:L-cystine transport system substrate-binding protein
MTATTALRGVAALVGLALALGACSSGGDDETPTSGSPGADTSLADIEKAGVLVVATEGTYRPFSFHEGGSGELTGFDVEVARAVGDKLGVDVKFEETQWDAIFAGLQAGRFDMIANQVTITPERTETYTFSQPYTVSNGVLVARADDTSIASFEDLDGKTTAQSLTSVWYDLAKSYGATVEAVEGWAQAIALVQQKRVDATINDKLTYLDYTTTEDASGVKVVAETDDKSQSAFPFAKGSASLAGAVNDALDALADDGTLAEISTKYFGADVTH